MSLDRRLDIEEKDWSEVSRLEEIASKLVLLRRLTIIVRIADPVTVQTSCETGTCTASARRVKCGGCQPKSRAGKSYNCRGWGR